MRLFIAIPLPEGVKDNARKLQEVLDRKEFKPARLDQMHLTIAFLGDKPDAEGIISHLSRIRFNRFSMKTKGIGTFPSRTTVRVVWMGLEENEDFRRLQTGIRKPFNFKEKLMPHITVARARQLVLDKEGDLMKRLSEVALEEIEFTIDRFVLFESVPGKEGYEHRALKEFLCE